MKPLDFSEAGPPLTMGNIESLQSDLGMKLPAEYVNFLVANNGGIPSRRFFPNPHDASDLFEVDRFYSLDQTNLTFGSKSSLRSIAAAIRQFSIASTETWLPIGLVEQEHALLLGVRGEQACQVHLLLTDEETAPPRITADSLLLICDSFNEFLNQLQRSPDE